MKKALQRKAERGMIKGLEMMGELTQANTHKNQYVLGKENTFVKVIEDEIKWCKDNDGAMPKKYRSGFIDGLKQAIYLINITRQ